MHIVMLLISIGPTGGEGRPVGKVFSHYMLCLLQSPGNSNSNPSNLSFQKISTVKNVYIYIFNCTSAMYKKQAKQLEKI